MSFEPGDVEDEATRFWCEPHLSVEFDGMGFLAEPRDDDFRSVNPHLLRTDELAVRRCVVMLGEPGMGKTYVLEQHRPLLGGSTVDVQSVHVDLTAYSEARLVRLFASDQFTGWLNGADTLCLTLDGFDEARRRIANLPALVADYVRQWPADRLYLRVACRTAEWPTWATDGLRDHLPDTVAVELQPLRQRDVPSLLPADIPSDQLLSAVRQVGVGPFAARPMTLKLLARIFRGAGGLPHRPAELYRRGTELLCDEQAGPRRDGESVSPEERLAVARRMAAISVFCGRPSFWLGPVSECPGAAATLDQCRSVSEPTTSGPMQVATGSVRAAVQTGLFSGREADAVGWAHGTFADFLAAEWVIAHGLTSTQVASLLLAADGRVYPQVKQVAAWLVSADPEAFGWLAERDPESFATNVDVPGDDLRRSVVAGLFALAAEDLLRREFATEYRSLKHPGLEEQIAPYLTSDTPPSLLRLAVDLADHCAVRSHLPTLTQLVYDQNIPHYERVHAAWAIEHLTRDEPDARLRALLDDPAALGDDPEDELLGAALLASWPHALTTGEALEHARQPKRQNLFGGYAMFLRRLGEKLTDADVQPAVAWLASHAAVADADHLRELVAPIVKLALTHLDDPDVRAVVVDYARQRARDHRPLLPDLLRSRRQGDPPIPVATRRLLAADLLRTGGDDIAYSVADLSAYGLSLITAADLPWVADQYASVPPTERSAYERLFSWLFSMADPAHVTFVLELPDDHPLVADLVGVWRAAVPLDSEHARTAREGWLQRKQLHEEDAENDQSPPIEEWIDRYLADIAGGDLSSFPHLLRLITVPPGSRYYSDEFQPDLTKHPRWERLPEETRSAILKAARRYLDVGDPDPDRWLGTNVRLFAAEAGYRALTLLQRLNPSALPLLPPHLWRRWAPILVSWDVAINAAEWEDKRHLFDLADPHAHDELREAVLTLTRAETANGQGPDHDDELEFLWDDEIATELLALAESAEAPQRDRLAALLAEHAPDLVRPVLHRWLEARAEDGDRAAVAFRVLLAHDAGPSWEQLRHVLEADPEFAAKVVLASGETMRYTSPSLSADQLADLYLWLITRFPPEQDPDIDEVHWVGPRESIGHWRDDLLGRIKGMASNDAVLAMAKISAHLPQYPWLRRTFADTADVFRAASWTALRISDLERLAAERGTRLVRSADELAELVVNGFDAIQRGLQGDTPDAPATWDTHSKRPKHEDEVSDFLRNRLQERVGGRGVSVNREVQVRRIRPTGVGERTDLRVDASADDPHAVSPILTIAGEVKGAWHPDVLSAMRDQLVDRYMRDLGVRHGIYVVLWFDIASWTDEDTRRARVESTAREDLQAALEAQAEGLAREGFNIQVVVLDCSLTRPAAQ